MPSSSRSLVPVPNPTPAEQRDKGNKHVMSPCVRLSQQGGTAGRELSHGKRTRDTHDLLPAMPTAPEWPCSPIHHVKQRRFFVPAARCCARVLFLFSVFR